MPDPTYEQVQSDTLTELLEIRDSVTAGRHPKWQRVEPGTVIPAGQPYRVEYGEYGTPGWNSHEFSSLNDFPRPGLGNDSGQVFVDSSWKPPLVLPTLPEEALREVVAWLEDKPEIPGRLGRSKVMRAVDDTCDYIASELRRRANEIEAAR